MSTDDTSRDFPGDRIAKVLSRAGVASRRDAERMISEGRVKVNGKPITSPALNVGPDDRISVDGTEIGPPEPVRLWLYHKPAGLVTSARDEEGRPTVFDNLPEGMPYVMSVGRLDLSSEGLLLLTNDGEIKRRLELPSTGWLRRYRVRVNGELTEEQIAPLRAGVTVDGIAYQPMDVSFDRQQGANAWLTVGLREGRNREIRRVMEHLGVQVNRLIRVSYGPFQLGDLEPGAVDEVRAKVVRDQLGLDAKRGAPAARAVEKPANRPVLSAGARAPAKAPRPRPLVVERIGRENADGVAAERPARKPRAATGAAKAAPWRRDDAAPSRSPGGRKPAGPRRGFGADGRKPREEDGEARPPHGAATARPARRFAGDEAERPARGGPGGARPRKDAPRGDGPRGDRPRGDSPRGDGPRGDGPRSEGPRKYAARSDAPRAEGPRKYGPRTDTPRGEASRPAGPRKYGPRAEGPRAEGEAPRRAGGTGYRPRSGAPAGEDTGRPPRSGPARDRAPRAGGEGFKGGGFKGGPRGGSKAGSGSAGPGRGGPAGGPKGGPGGKPRSPSPRKGPPRKG